MADLVSGEVRDAAAPWTPAWVRDAVFYQIFPDRFARSDRVVPPGPLEPWDTPPTRHGFKGGDLYGVLEHLDHIQGVGATAIYLNPIFQSASNHRYHTFDYLAVDPMLGGDAALRALIDGCHARGMRIVLDGVFNHASRGFWPFHHVLEAGAASPYRGWFFLDDARLEAGRGLRPYPSDDGTPDRAHIDGLREFGYEAWWGLPALPKIDTSNPAARAYLLGVAEHWLRFGIDGWRLDVAEEVPDEFWREFRRRVKAVDPDAYIVAEIWHEAESTLRGDQYDALMHYPLGAAITSFVGAGHLDRRVLDQQDLVAAAVHDDDAATFAARLERALTVYDPAVTAVQLNLLDSHDTPRFLSMVGGDTPSLRLAMLLLATLPGAPSIYYGDEIGLTGENDPASRGTIPWDAPERWDHALYASIAGTMALRHAHPVLRRGEVRMVAATGQTIAFLRSDDDATALVVVNAGHEPAHLDLDLPGSDGRTFATQRWSEGPAGVTATEVHVTHGRLALDVGPRDGAVLLAR